MVRSASLASLALVLLAPPPARAAEEIPPEPGVYWEQSVSMEMQGFSMPAQTQKVCVSKKGLTEPPRGQKDDGKCEMTDVKRSGSRMTWKMKCKDGSTGEGDITSGPDAFDGTMVMRTQGHEMNMKMKGKRVGGDCDANELRRKLAGLQKQADDTRAQIAESQAQSCEKGAAEVRLELFVPPFPGVPVQCKDPAKLCANLETRDGLVALRDHGGKDAKEKAGKLCKKDLDDVVDRLCPAARKDYEKGKSDATLLEFVFGYCPDVAKALAKKECAGRRFTTLPRAQRDFCTRWAEKGLAGGDEAERAPAAKAPAGKYLSSGIPDVDDAEKPAKKDKKKKPADDDEDEGPKKKDPEDMKSKIMKGLFGR